MILKKEIVKEVRKRTGELQPVYDYKLNIDFWKNTKEPINVVLDEAHSIINARRAMSKTNVILNDWLSLVRRILGSTEADFGELVFITQLPNRIDVIAREMATQVRYHICHYYKVCRKCGLVWKENSEMPEGYWSCPKCNSFNIKKFNHQIEIWKFANMSCFEAWRNFNQRTFYARYFITDIEKYFKLYDTLQWDNLFSEYY